MYSTGVTRKIDPLGRFTIPSEVRRQFDWEVGDELELFIQDNTMIIRKYHKTCAFCNGQKELFQFKDKLICKECLIEIGVDPSKLSPDDTDD